MNNLSRISKTTTIISVIFCTIVILTEYPFVSSKDQLFFLASRIGVTFLPLLFLKRIEKDPHDFVFIGVMTLSYTIYNSIGYMYRPFYLVSFAQTSTVLAFLYFPKRNHYIFLSVLNYLSFVLVAYLTHENLPYKKGDETIIDIFITPLIASTTSFLVYHYFTANRNFKDKLFERFTSLGRVTTTIVHDLKGSLGAPLMVLSSLEESIHKNDTFKSQENLALLKKQLISLTQVVSKLNQLSDITESHAIVKPFLVSECIDSVRLILAKRLSNVQFSFQGDCQLQGSKELFTSIMLNIITNALDEFMLNRISDGKIEIEASPTLISIKDNGTGFDNQTAKKLSDGEMFSTKDMGSGLGLYLVRESLKSFSGKLQIENSKDGANIHLIFKSKKTVN